MFDIYVYLENKNLQPIKIKEEEISIDCPFCERSEKHFQISTDENNPTFYCYRCGSKGSYVRLVMKIDKISYNEANVIVNGGVNLSVSEEKEKYNFPNIEFPLKSLWTSQSREYLRRRGIKESTIRKFGLYFCSTGKYKDRIIIPIRLDDKDITFQGRLINNTSTLRYRSPPSSPTNRLLFNCDDIDNDTVILVEGVFDVFRLYQDGYGNQVGATLGKKISEHQINLLKDKNVKRVWLMYDPDTKMETETLFNEVACHFEPGFIPIDSGDPADMESVHEAIENVMCDPCQILSYLAKRESEKYFLTSEQRFAI